MEKSARLIVIKGLDIGRIIDVGRDGAHVGRSSGNDIAINDEKISRRHCRIYFSPDGILQVSDLRSANDTLVNNKPVHDGTLKRGDLITVGDTVLKVEDDASPAKTKGSASTDQNTSQSVNAETDRRQSPLAQSTAQSRSRKLAFAGFLSGLLIITFPLAMVLGLLAHAQMTKHGELPKARTMANWAIGLGMLWLAVTLLVLTRVM